MPAVKKLHQESDGNTKPEYIFGHSCQAVTLAVKAGAGFRAAAGLPYPRGSGLQQSQPPHAS